MSDLVGRQDKRITTLETGEKEQVFTASIVTTDGSTQVIHSFDTDGTTVYLIEAKVVAVRTDVGGNTNTYIRAIHAESIAGVAAIANGTFIYIDEDVAAWNVSESILGSFVELEVTGSAGQTINWFMRATVVQAS